MATKVKAEKFAKTNKGNIKDAHRRTRSGASKERTRVSAHTKTHKHR